MIFSIYVFDLLLFSLFGKGAIALCTTLADFFLFSTDFEVVCLEFQDVRASVESNFCWMVTGCVET